MRDSMRSFSTAATFLSKRTSNKRAKPLLMRAPAGRDVLLEGELGMIGSGSEVLDAPPADIDKDLTDPQQAAHFARETGIDLIAPAVGNMHGVLRSGAQQKLDTKRIEEIAQASGLPVVLHGGSGSSDADFVASAKAGAAEIHISTDLRVAYRKGIEQGLASLPDEVAPYKYIGPGAQPDRSSRREIHQIVCSDIAITPKDFWGYCMPL